MKKYLLSQKPPMFPTIGKHVTSHWGRLLGLLLLLAPTVAWISAGGISSTTFINPHTTFLLGGDQHGAFTVRIRNAGLVNVSVLEVSTSGDTLARDVLKPLQGGIFWYSPGAGALIRNVSARQATVKLHISGDRDLQMRYLDPPATEAR